ncbi:MAG: hypothetical protein AAGA68_14530 [Pseudomonadota bacterium]
MLIQSPSAKDVVQRRFLATSALTCLLSLGHAALAQGLFVTLPDWNDEDSAYRDPARGLTVDAGFFEHIEGGNYSDTALATFGGLDYITNTEMHEITEGDDLWTAYHMWKRLDGVRPTTVWRQRMENLKTFFVESYVDELTGPGRETENNYDHLYGWGLCDWYKTEADGEPDGGAAALAAIDGIVAAMVSWNPGFSANSPGDQLLDRGNGSRRWARQLRFAVCASEVSPTASNLAWRDQVVDMVLQAPDFDATYGMYFNGSGPTGSNGFDYAAGDRIANTFHMGIWMDSLWHAWRVLNGENDPRAETLRERLVSMATYYRDFGPDPDGRVPLLTGLNINTGVRLDTSASGYGTQNVYTLSSINGLVFAYKFTGEGSYLEAAWARWGFIQEFRYGPATVGHYTDSLLASATGFRFLAQNRGELQYTYALFENAGQPIVLGPAPKPPTEFRVVE